MSDIDPHDPIETDIRDPETGHQLHATAFKRTLGWTKIADGRRIHDLRHTAACMWLARGVDPITVLR